MSDEIKVHEPEFVPPSALEAISKAEVDSQITTARRYPRELSAVKKSMIGFATLDEETAESCFYNLPRGGKNIQGPSVRLAEIAVSCYGNLRAGSRVVQVVHTGDNPHVVVQAVAHDLEKNVAITIEKRRRITKKKSKTVVDEDDINLAANAGCAIAFRDAVFKVIPGALIKPVYEAAVKVAVGDDKTLVDRRARAFDTFAKMGVSKERVLAMLGKADMETVDLQDLETLTGLRTAIKDGQTTIDESFPPEPPKFMGGTRKPGSELFPAGTGGKPTDEELCKQLEALCDKHAIAPADFLQWCDANKIAEAAGKISDLAMICPGKLPRLVADFATIVIPPLKKK